MTNRYKAPLLSMFGDKTKLARSIYDRAINGNKSRQSVSDTEYHWKRLIQAYKEPVYAVNPNELVVDRSYHNFNHIINGLQHICNLEEQRLQGGFPSEWNKALGPDIDDLFLAWFYHDYHYKTGVDGLQNEKESAIQARNDLEDLGVDNTRIVIIEDLIKLTDHQSNPEINDSLGNLIVDIDLVGFSTKPQSEFDETTKKVRHEFSMYSDEQWSDGRLKFLQRLMERKQGKILRTPFFRKFNNDAVENVEREIAFYSNRIAELYS